MRQTMQTQLTQPIKTTQTKCDKCKRKHSVLLPCKCKNHYCPKHIQPELHGCLQISMYVSEAKTINQKILYSAQKDKHVEWLGND